MSAANGFLGYSFTQYITATEVANDTILDVIHLEPNSGDQWRLEVLMGCGCDVWLTLNQRGCGDCSFNVKLSVLDDSGQTKLEFVDKVWKNCGFREVFGIPNELLEELISSNCQRAEIRVAIIKIPKPSKTDELSTSFKSEWFGDVEIECGDGVKLYCHKGILAAKSSVFATMFSVEMKDSVENRIRIEDFSSDVISVLLQFCYLGDWGDLSNVADRVYVAADKLQLEKLKWAAAAGMIVNLNGDSIVSTLRLAQLYKDKVVADGCVDYLANHKGDLSVLDVMAEFAKYWSRSADLPLAMSAANGLWSYNFTQYIHAGHIAKKKSLEQSYSNHNNGDYATLEILTDPPNCRVYLTIREGSENFCFNVKLSLLDNDGQAKLELVRKEWQSVGVQEAFLIPHEVLQELTNLKQAAINVAIVKIRKPSPAVELSTSLNSESFGDVKIECADGKIFYCHKDMLAAKSLVFATMFNLGMKESVENRVRIDDVSSDVMSVLLRFCYLGDWGDLSSISTRLYVAANHYQLEQLKLAATAELILNLNAESVESTLQLAQLYKDKLLGDGCDDYLACHKSEISAMEVVAEATKNE